MNESMRCDKMMRAGNGKQLIILEWPIIKISTRSFKIYGIWPQANIQTHARAQCSNGSVGLAQARPNYSYIIQIPVIVTLDF